MSPSLNVLKLTLLYGKNPLITLYSHTINKSLSKSLIVSHLSHLSDKEVLLYVHYDVFVTPITTKCAIKHNEFIYTECHNLNTHAIVCLNDKGRCN